MMKVTDLPSGQRLVWPLQIFTRSGTAAPKQSWLCWRRPRDRGLPPKTLLAVAINKENVNALRKNTLAPAKDKFAHFEILVEFGQGLNGQEGHVPLETLTRSRKQAVENWAPGGWQEAAYRVGYAF